MPFLLTVLLSLALGILSGLGVGGGSLLIIWLTLVCKIDYPTAKYMNLLFFLPPALIATILHFFQKKLRIKQIVPAIIAGCAASAALTLLSGDWDTGILRRLFGVLLLLTALRELRQKKKQGKPPSR